MTVAEKIKKMKTEEFQQDLIRWYEAEHRDLPWRRDSDPYKIWVSEIMLQQTRVETVIPYFHRFLEEFPTIESFAEADEESVLKIWEGLGYYSRVRNLHSAVKEVVAEYGGKVPDNKKDFLKLKGVGPYTAGAVLSIAYGKPEPAVDGNVMRVLSRILCIAEDIAKPSSRKNFEEAARKLMYDPNPSHFNQALMELGSLVCTPASPSCLLCPVQKHCLAFDEGLQDRLPVKTRKKSTRHDKLAAIVLQNDKGNILVRKRPGKGLLANLWEFPSIPLHPLLDPHEALQDFLMTEYSVDAEIKPASFGTVDHVFTHLKWTIHAFCGKTTEVSARESERLRFVSETEMGQLAFPVSHQKIWQAYKMTLKNERQDGNES